MARSPRTDASNETADAPESDAHTMYRPATILGCGIVLLATVGLFFSGDRQGKLMFQQHELLRRSALTMVVDLVRGIARDAAMLLYLDSATNRKIQPNENFAREVMELVCLGLGN